MEKSEKPKIGSLFSLRGRPNKKKLVNLLVDFRHVCLQFIRHEQTVIVGVYTRLCWRAWGKWPFHAMQWENVEKYPFVGVSEWLCVCVRRIGVVNVGKLTNI